MPVNVLAFCNALPSPSMKEASLSAFFLIRSLTPENERMSRIYSPDICPEVLLRSSFNVLLDDDSESLKVFKVSQFTSPGT